MSHSGDAAEQMVRMSLEGAEVAAKITGAGAKQVAVLLYAILRDQQKTKGKTRLTNLLRSGKELKVFAVKDEDLKKFCKEAKKYGVLYCVLKDKHSKDGITDIMVRAEDASKINRIFERFQLASVDFSQVKEDIQRSQPEQTAQEAGEKPKGNPTKAKTGPSHPSEPTSEPKRATDRDNSDRATSRPSVRQELNEIREGQKRRKETDRTRAPQVKKPQHKRPGKGPKTGKVR